LAYVSLKRGDVAKAREQLKMAYTSDHQDSETILLAARMDALAFDWKATEQDLALLAKVALRTNASREWLFRLLEDNTRYDFVLDNGSTVRGVLSKVNEALLKRQVGLRESTFLPINDIYNKTTKSFRMTEVCKGAALRETGGQLITVAVLGTGLWPTIPVSKAAFQQQLTLQRGDWRSKRQLDISGSPVDRQTER